MGIPSYFSHIVKEYRHIIKDMKSLRQVNNFYLDSNSLIYDAVKNNPTYDKTKHKEYENELMNMVCAKIDFYVDTLQPRDRVFIAFDGVAPVAKLSQQRDRRYKSWYTSQIQRDLEGAAYKESWNTSAITPGTEFMKNLNTHVTEYYEKKNKNPISILSPKYIVSSSMESGEGEHKIFEYIRKYPEYHNSPDTTTLIYGLDADLFMLTLNHLHITNNKNMYLFRDTPEFIKSIDSSLDANRDYLLDIPELAIAIVDYMHQQGIGDGGEKNTSTSTSTLDMMALQTNRIKDYIFLCFLLGNDFLPHFPAVNIRTGGIHILLNVYRETLGSDNTKFLTKSDSETATNTIQWKNFNEFVSHIAKTEDSLLMEEHKRRDKAEKRIGYQDHSRGHGQNHVRNERNERNNTKSSNSSSSSSSTSPSTSTLQQADEVLGTDIYKVDELLTLPMKERSVEKYINPFQHDWEYRYYKSLFDMEITDERKRQICMNYLEGLEWTYNYYTTGCIDWRWCYKFHYAPLFKDLVKYIPYMNTNFLQKKEKHAIEDIVQLCYVLPKANLNLLPFNVNIILLQRLGHLYGEDYDFKWAYCRYFWESHAELPTLNIEILESIVCEAKNIQTFAVSPAKMIPQRSRSLPDSLSKL
jgi:5'-3' exonuclease